MLSGTTSPSRKGRKHYFEDIWAYKQVNICKRPLLDVRREWKILPKVIARKLVDPDRQFQRIVKLDWFKE